MATEIGEKGKFKSAQKLAYESVNEVLKLDEKSSSGDNVHADFSKWEGTDMKDGVFRDKELFEMLETKDNVCAHVFIFWCRNGRKT